MSASTSGKVRDVYGFSGLVNLIVDPEFCQFSRPLGASLSPDDARLLGLRLIRAADKAEEES